MCRCLHVHKGEQQHCIYAFIVYKQGIGSPYLPAASVTPSQAVGEPRPPIVPARLQLPGEVAGLGSSVAAGEGGACSPSSCVWLSGVLASASEEQLMEAFAQFGCPQKVGW